MRGEAEKGIEEMRLFERFVRLSNFNVVPGSIQKRRPPEPDLLCEIAFGGMVGFELTEACASEYKALESAVARGCDAEVVWARDTAVETIRKKLLKSYPVSYPVELVMHAGLTAAPDHLLKAWVEPYALSTTGPFRRIWLMGEQLELLAAAEG